jgi:hypothetical protein
MKVEGNPEWKFDLAIADQIGNRALQGDLSEFDHWLTLLDPQGKARMTLEMLVSLHIDLPSWTIDSPMIPAHSVDELPALIARQGPLGLRCSQSYMAQALVRTPIQLLLTQDHLSDPRHLPEVNIALSSFSSATRRSTQL